MILVDSNVPMYLIGDPHPHKTDAQRVLERLAVAGERLVTDAEVFQEILHRYRGIDRRDRIQDAFDTLGEVVDEVLPITLAIVELARDVLLARWALSARDAVHLAVMQHHGIERIVSYDRAFDGLPGAERLH